MRKAKLSFTCTWPNKVLNDSSGTDVNYQRSVTEKKAFFNLRMMILMEVMVMVTVTVMAITMMITIMIVTVMMMM